MKFIKTLGLAIAMALALIAIAGASLASAAIFEVPGAGSEETTVWNGVTTGKAHKLTLGGDSFTCSNVTLSGGQMKGKSTSQISLAPKLGGCTWLGSSVVWSEGTCRFQLNQGTGTEKQTTGTLDIVGCGTPMTFTASGCQLQIGNQTGLGTVKYTRTESEGIQSVNAAANLSGLTYTRTGGSCGGSGNGMFKDGTYVGEWKVRPAHFAVEKTTAFLTATKEGTSGNVIFNFKGLGKLNCGEVASTGTIGALNTESITFSSTTFSSCIFLGFSTTPSMGGCNFKYTASGGVQIVGATARPSR